MMNCEFDPSKCTIECKKYSMCAYRYLQSQIIPIQEQLIEIYKFIKESEVRNAQSLNATKKNFEDDINLLLALFDSEKNKELKDEKDNK